MYLSPYWLAKQSVGGNVSPSNATDKHWFGHQAMNPFEADRTAMARTTASIKVLSPTGQGRP